MEEQTQILNKKRKIIFASILGFVLLAVASTFLVLHHIKTTRNNLILKSIKEVLSTEQLQAKQDIIMGIKGDSSTILLQGEPYIEAGAFAIDKTTGPITEYETDGTVDTSQVGEYEIKYTFKSRNASSDITRTVKVISAEEFGSKASQVSVLAYHYVCKDDDTESIKNKFTVTVSALEQQIKYLKDNNYYFPSFQELRAYIDGTHSLPAKSVIITFDDGGTNFLENGTPIFEKYEVPVVSYAIGQYRGKTDAALKVLKYANPYICFENHTFALHEDKVSDKAPITFKSKDDLIADFTKNNQITGNNDSLAYPYGEYTKAAQEAVAEMNIPCTFVFKNGRVHVGDNPTILRRMIIYNSSTFQEFLNSL